MGDRDLFISLNIWDVPGGEVKGDLTTHWKGLGNVAVNVERNNGLFIGTLLGESFNLGPDGNREKVIKHATSFGGLWAGHLQVPFRERKYMMTSESTFEVVSGPPAPDVNEATAPAPLEKG